jgi:DnaJ domain
LPPVDLDAARRLLGVDASASEAELRAAYRSALRRTHPDVAGAGRASDRATADVVDAYRLLAAGPTEPAPTPIPTPAPTTSSAAVSVDGDTVVADLPAGDLYPILLDVADRLGDITHVEPESGVLEFLVDLPGRGPCSVLLTLQGRATGVTEAWCTVEPLRGGPPPPTDEVAALLAAGMRAALDAVR